MRQAMLTPALPQDLCYQAGSKWSLTKVAVAHKTGLCPVGETSVVIVVSSTHRQDALQVATYLGFVSGPFCTKPPPLHPISVLETGLPVHEGSCVAYRRA